MINNVWRVNVNNYFKLNFDDNAVEIIDQYNKVAVSVEIIGRQELRVYGALNLGAQDGGWIVMSKSGFAILGTRVEYEKAIGNDWDAELEKLRSEVPRIFSYEGLNYIGKRLGK